MEDNEAQLAEQLLNSGWNKLVKTVKDFVIVDKSEEATVSTYVDGQNQCMSKAQDSDNNHISDLSDELLEINSLNSMKFYFEILYLKYSIDANPKTLNWAKRS
ncbi:uncharacterized protein OCT59_008461 [Rhizophagus irregularis]|uniref:uncharacterized protein n=1 Tax=Rhizophagus irregularis TaxID=588596 RepID=UPI003319026D|nr:hypothetical protein OCT59_008461 [Rhizophagus irregularis]